MIIFFDLGEKFGHRVLVQKRVFLGAQAFSKLYFSLGNIKKYYFENINSLICESSYLRKKIYLRTSGTSKI